MSLAYEQLNESHEPQETSDETYQLTAWFADPARQATEPMPPLSPLTQRRLNGLVADDHEFGFQMAMANLFDIADERRRQVAYLYMCGYSESDLELMAPDVPVATIELIVDSWSGLPAEGAELHVVHDGETTTKERIAAPKVARDLGRTATKKTTTTRKPRQPKSIEPSFEFDDSTEDEASEVIKSTEPLDRLDQPAPAADIVRVYLNGMGKVALLNAAQEVELAKRIETGLYASKIIEAASDDRYVDGVAPQKLTRQQERELLFIARDGNRAKDHLLEANLRLVVNNAKRYQGRGLPLLDLIQEGNLGLIRAMEKFDFAKGYKFSTYATWWIKQAVARGLADQGRTIRIPVHSVEKINKISRVRRELMQTLGRDPTHEELAHEVGIDPEKMTTLLVAGRGPLSLDETVGDGDEASLGDFIEDIGGINPLAAVEAMDMNHQLEKAIATLKKQEQQVVRLRFGLDGGQPQTLDQVGKQFNLSRESIRHIERDLMGKLRQLSQGGPLSEYVGAQPHTGHELIDITAKGNIVREAVSLLPAKQQATINVVYGLNGRGPRTNEEAARLLGVSVGTVSTHLMRAKEKLGEMMADIDPSYRTETEERAEAARQE